MRGATICIRKKFVPCANKMEPHLRLITIFLRLNIKFWPTFYQKLQLKCSKF